MDIYRYISEEILVTSERNCGFAPFCNEITEYSHLIIVLCATFKELY